MEGFGGSVDLGRRGKVSFRCQSFFLFYRYLSLRSIVEETQTNVLNLEMNISVLSVNRLC